MSEHDILPRGTFVYYRKSHTVIPKPGQTMDFKQNDFDRAHYTHVVAAAQDEIANQAKQIAELEAKNDELRFTLTLKGVLDKDRAETLEAENAKLRSRVTELEADNKWFSLCRIDNIQTIDWLRTDLVRMGDKLEAVRGRLANTKAVLAGSQVGNARLSRRVKRLRFKLETADRKLFLQTMARNEQREKIEQLETRLESAAVVERKMLGTIALQRESLAERMATCIRHFASSKSDGKWPTFAPDQLRSAYVAIIIDDDTGESRVIKNNGGGPRCTFDGALETLRNELAARSSELAYERSKVGYAKKEAAQMEADYHEACARAVEHWRNVQTLRTELEAARAKLKSANMENLGLKLALGFERVASILTIAALRFQILRNESFEMERKRLLIESLKLKADDLQKEVDSWISESTHFRDKVKDLEKLNGQQREIISVLSGRPPRLGGTSKTDIASTYAIGDLVEITKSAFCLGSRLRIVEIDQSNNQWPVRVRYLRGVDVWLKAGSFKLVVGSLDSATSNQAKHEAAATATTTLTKWNYAIGDRVEVIQAHSLSSMTDDRVTLDIGERATIFEIDYDDSRWPIRVHTSNAVDGWLRAGSFKLVGSAP